MIKHLILLLLPISLIETFPHKNGINSLDHNYTNLNFIEINNKRRLKDEFKPIEIYYDFSNFKSSDNTIPDEILENAKKLFKEVALEFKKFLKMKKFEVILDKTLEEIKQSCEIEESEEIPENFFNSQDIIIYPLIDQLETGVLAQSSYCMLQGKIIPRFGFIIIDKDTLLSDKGNDYFKILIFHEITHILIFDPELLNALGFINSERNEINSTKALSMARKHFNCGSLEGIPLENDGGSGTARAHWEASYMFGDYMMGSNYIDAQLSDITLALFDDAFFYQVEYYSGGLFKFGKNKGCGFFEKDCSDFPDEFCSNFQEDKCTNSRTAIGLCFKGMLYQCPIVKSYIDGLCFQSFEPEDNNGDNYKLFCLTSSLTPEGSLENYSEQPYCYKAECDTKNKQIKIYYSNSLYIICKNSEIFENPKGFKGKIACPNYYDICDSTSLCNNLFDCLNKKSKTLEESYDYNKKEEIVDSNTSNQIFTVKSMESSWISCFKMTNSYVIYLYGDFSKEVKILDKVTIELTTSKSNKIKAICTPFDKSGFTEECLQCDINICKYPLENVDLFLPLETPKQAGYIIKNWANVIGKEPGVSNRISGVNCIPKIKNTFIPSSIEGIGCEKNYYKFKINGKWESSNKSSLPNLLSSIELFLNNENKDLIECDYNGDSNTINFLCQFDKKGEISIKEQYFEGIFEAFLLKDVPSSITADSCDDDDDDDGNKSSKSSFIDLNFFLIILIIMNFFNF